MRRIGEMPEQPDKQALLEEMKLDSLGLDPTGTARKFYYFHEDNRNVYRALVELARTTRSEYGMNKLGMDMIYSGVRWNKFKQTRGESTYKLDARYCSFYSRLIMMVEPDLQGIFDTRDFGINKQNEWLNRYRPIFSV